jgi:hypothetical protein
MRLGQPLVDAIIAAAQQLEIPDGIEYTECVQPKAGFHEARTTLLTPEENIALDAHLSKPSNCPLRFFLERKQDKNMATRSRSRTSKRELIAPKGSKRYIRRNSQREFKKEVDVGRSLAADRRQHAKTKVPKGQGDRGDTI